jgi:YesN/AraC family two-component response regulator
MLIDVFLISLYNWAEPLPLTQWQFLVALSALYLQGIALFSIYRPQVFFNSIKSFAEKVAPEKLTEPSAGASAEKQYRSIDESIAKQLELQLKAIMQSEKPWLDNDLSLAKLAAELDITSHQLSELLNVHFEKSFYEYINHYRMDYAIELMKIDTRKAVLDIAYDSGFNNKNSFYRLFKERTGKTPASYRKALTMAKSA